MTPGQVNIICAACGAESFLKRTPRYDGFKKTGEILSCASCGHVYSDESQVPFKSGRKPKIFDDSDKVREISVFRDEEKGKACRYCKHYVVNPFTQRCGKHHRAVEATDLCFDFDLLSLEKEK